MWHALPKEVIQQRTNEIAAVKRRELPKSVAAIIATLLFIGGLFAIAYLDQQFGPRAVEIKTDQPYSLQNASLPALISVFGATVIYMYFLFVKNRRVPVVYVCFDCQEAFHAQTTCPECQSARVSDIRLAEWVKDT